MAVEIWRKVSDKEKFCDFARAVLDNPLDRDCSEYATFRRHTDGRQQRLVTQDGSDSRQGRLEELKDVEGEIPSSHA